MIPRTGIIVSKKELLGLLVVFIGYVLLGGLVFMVLESPLEEKERLEFEELLNELNEFNDKLDRLGDPNVTGGDIKGLIQRLSDAKCGALVVELGNDTHSNWSFENSFFFAITVVTTIGYGHLSPSTAPGRLFCVAYATVGIPLTGILLAAIGGHYSQRLVRGLQRARRTALLPLCAARYLLPWLCAFLVLPAALFMYLEDWSFLDSFYYCFITLSTIGFGDLVAGNFKGDYVGVYKTFVVLWIIFGLGYLAMILNYISRMMRCKQIRRVERKLSSSIYHTQQRVGQRLDEVYQLLHDVSRNRNVKNRRCAIKRMQSYPAPELKDKNHNNHKIQKLLSLVQNLKNEEERPYRRRLSLPLPATPLQPASFGRGSLQVFSSALQDDKKPMGNGVKTLTADEFVDLGRGRHRPRNPSFAGIDVISAEPPILIVKDPRTVLEMEGLQCTRV